MSGIDLFFLGLVLVAFTGFAVTLAYYSQRDRLPKNPGETHHKAAPVKATTPGKVLEHA